MPAYPHDNLAEVLVIELNMHFFGISEEQLCPANAKIGAAVNPE